MAAVPESTKNSLNYRLYAHAKDSGPNLPTSRCATAPISPMSPACYPTANSSPMPAPLRRLRPLLRICDLLRRQGPVRGLRSAHRAHFRQPSRRPRHCLYRPPRRTGPVAQGSTPEELPAPPTKPAGPGGDPARRCLSSRSRYWSVSATLYRRRRQRRRSSSGRRSAPPEICGTRPDRVAWARNAPAISAGSRRGTGAQGSVTGSERGARS